MLDPNDALLTLLDQWRRSRDRRVAVAIAALGVRVEPIPLVVEAVAPSKKSPKQRGLDERRVRREAWCARAALGDPRDLAILLPTLFEKGSVANDATDANFAEFRLRALRHHDGDPRIGAQLMAAIAELPFRSTSTVDMWRLVFAMLPQHVGRDEGEALPARIAEAIAKFVGGVTLTAVFTKELTRAQRGLAVALARTTPLTPKDLRALAALEADLIRHAPRPTRQAEAETLLAAIEADPDSPDNDAMRLVYADNLLEGGDVRGEFIVLQFKAQRGEATREDRARQKQLQAQHARAWLGPVADVLLADDLVFERGFLHAGTLAQKTNVPAAYHAAKGDPRWRTLRELTQWDSGWRGMLDDFVAHDAFRGLRSLRGCLANDAKAILTDRQPRPLHTLGLVCSNRDALLAALVDATGVPELRTLAIGQLDRTELAPSRWAPLLRSSLAARLDTLELELVSRPEPPVELWRGVVAVWCAALPRSLTTFVLMEDALRLELRRDAARWALTVQVERRDYQPNVTLQVCTLAVHGLTGMVSSATVASDAPGYAELLARIAPSVATPARKQR